jgi:hypothetical protein
MENENFALCGKPFQTRTSFGGKRWKAKNDLVFIFSLFSFFFLFSFLFFIWKNQSRFLNCGTRKVENPFLQKLWVKNIVTMKDSHKADVTYFGVPKKGYLLTILRQSWMFYNQITYLFQIYKLASTLRKNLNKNKMGVASKSRQRSFLQKQNEKNKEFDAPNVFMSKHTKKSSR